MSICGILVEPRPLRAIPILIDNFFRVLPSTPLYMFCGCSSYPHFTTLYKNNYLVRVISLVKDNLPGHEYNDLLKTRQFWDHIQEDYALTIQTDGCLCESSTYKIQDFLHYDYIGGYTPNKWWWKETQGLHSYDDYQCFNGGFSLRKVSCMKEVIDTFPPAPSQGFVTGLSFESYPEDLYFVVGLLKLGRNVALDEFAINFCTHTHYVAKTFCVHKYDNYVDEPTLKKFLEYCPLFFYFSTLPV